MRRNEKPINIKWNQKRLQRKKKSETTLILKIRLQNTTYKNKIRVIKVRIKNYYKVYIFFKLVTENEIRCKIIIKSWNKFCRNFPEIFIETFILIEHLCSFGAKIYKNTEIAGMKYKIL